MSNENTKIILKKAQNTIPLWIPIIFILILLSSIYLFYTSSETNKSNDSSVTYMKYTEKYYDINGELITNEFIIFYSQIDLIKVSHKDEIPHQDIENFNHNQNDSKVFIIKGLVDIEIDSIHNLDELKSNIVLTNNQIEDVKLFLKYSKQSQAPPPMFKKVYIVGEIDKYEGPTQYDKSKLFTQIIDLTDNINIDEKKTKKEYFESKYLIKDSYKENHYNRKYKLPRVR